MAPLLTSRRFLPLMISQTTGAFNDNLFKNAMVVLVLYRSAELGELVAALAGGVFILPYGVLSALAGRLADKLDKAALARRVKAAEIGLMALGCAGLATGEVWLLMATLFGLGVQAAFFSPIKYGLLPEHLSEHELLKGNGWIEAGMFGGILAGTLAGGALILHSHGPWIVGGGGVLVSLLGWAVAQRIPDAPAIAPQTRVSWNLFADTWALIRESRQTPEVWRAIVGLSGFWAVGAVLLAEFPILVKSQLAANESALTLMLLLFSVGIAVGSVLCAKLLHDEPTARFARWSGAAIGLFTLDFAFAVDGAGTLADASAVLAAPAGWRIMADLFALSVAGGIFSTPLYAMMQEYAPPAQRSSAIGSNNVVNAVAIVIAVGIAAGLKAAGLSATDILKISALLTVLGALRV